MVFLFFLNILLTTFESYFKIIINSIFGSIVLQLTYSMLDESIKKQAHSLNSSQSKLERTSKKPVNVRTVQIFIGNLDKQISQSYAKLRRVKNKQISAKKEGNTEEQTQPFANSSALITLEQSRYNPQNYSTTSPTNTLPTEPDIILLNNKDVMEYVRYVYETYNIKDPLEDSQYVEEKEQEKQYMTNKKIRDFKDKLTKEIGSASTMKNSHLHKSIELKPFGYETETGFKKSPVAGAKIEVISLSSKYSSGNISQERLKIENGRKQTHRIGNRNLLTKKQKINLTRQRLISEAGGSVSLPQLFRFCFMCEEPILQVNLKSHENQCEPLKDAFEKSLEDLVEILDRKIYFLTKQIEVQLFTKSQQEIKNEFMRIKSSVKEWMRHLPCETLPKTSQSEGFIKLQKNNWRSKFNKIQENITQSVCSSFQLIHKLQWFSKLRENITHKFFTQK